MRLDLLNKKILIPAIIIPALYFGFTVYKQDLSEESHTAEAVLTDQSTETSYPQESYDASSHQDEPQAVHAEPVKTKNIESVAEQVDSSIDYDTKFFDEKSQRIQSDMYGNHYVDLSNTHSTLKQYLVSDWPIYYPTPQDIQEGRVEGCMSLNYYVSLNARVTLLVSENDSFRMHHSVCEYDYMNQTYQLKKLNAPSIDMLDSIQALVDKIKN